MDNQKKIAGEHSVQFIEDGMTVGLGSGTTVYWMMKKLGELVKKGLVVHGVPSSRKTERWAHEFGISLKTLAEIDEIDIAIDGADEIDGQLNLIKGGGGSLVREKIIDSFANHLIIIADESKMVSELGSYPLPIEVTPFGWEITAKKISQLGCKPEIRVKDNQVFISDNGNHILDCRFERISDPKTLHENLKLLVGVVETGLFIEMTDKVIIGKDQEIDIINYGCIPKDCCFIRE
ncbi:ribose-5-phosphate isomerase RpiA [Virgibacillus necropolis]|uniref:ribose-5-phosphate isomerase RpiA n=1 Tax=Virgibacillus necropolis TaxID=163877 RepID=UPI00384EEF6A